MPGRKDSQYVLARGMKWRMIGREHVEVCADGDSIALPLIWYLILLKFTKPATFEEACAAFGVELRKHPEVRQALSRLHKARVLRRKNDEPVPDGILDLLDPDIFSERSNKKQIAAHLRAGRLVVIKNAFRKKVARGVHGALKTTTRWRPHEAFSPNFFYSHHNLYDPWEWPAVLRDLQITFASAATRSFIADLTGQDCSADPTFSASLYLPGDHSLPHNDGAENRTVAYVWHLTENWKSEWGGALYWCPSGTTIMPTFNTLFLFVVSDTSEHFVTTVSPHARSQRIAVNGWWRKAPDGVDKPAKGQKGYGPAAKEICGGRVVVIGH